MAAAAPTAALAVYATAQQGSYTRTIATDADGGAVVVGQRASNLAFDGRSMTHRGKGDVWAARHDASGVAVWMQMWGGTEADDGLAVAVDGKTDGVYIAGVFKSPSMTMGDVTLSKSSASLTDDDIFLARLDGNTGDVIWAKAFGSTMDDGAAASEAAVSLAVAADGSVLVAGTFLGASLPLADGLTLANPNAATGGASSFLATVNAADGSVVSADAFPDMPSLSRMVRDGQTGAVYLVGADYVTRLGSNGWRASLAGSSTTDARRSIALDPSSRYVFVAGQFTAATLTLGTLTVKNQNKNGGSNDAFLARMDAATGEYQWAQRLVGAGAEIVLGLAANADSVYAAGTYSVAFV